MHDKEHEFRLLFGTGWREENTWKIHIIYVLYIARRMKKRWLRVLGDKSHRNDSSFSCKPPEYWSIRSMTTGLLHGFVWIPRKRKKLSLTSLNKWLKESRHQRREWIYIVLCSNSITLLVWWAFHQEVRRRNEKRQRKRIQMKKKKKKKS